MSLYRMIAVTIVFSALTLANLSCGNRKKDPSKNTSQVNNDDDYVEEIIEFEPGFFDLHDYERGEDFGTIPLEVYRIPVPVVVPSFDEIQADLPPPETLEERYNLPEGLKEILDTYDAMLIDLTPSGYLFDVFTNEQVTVPYGECLSVAYDNDTGAFFSRKDYPVDPLLGFFYYEFDILVSGDLCLDEVGRIAAFKNQGTLALPEEGIENFISVATVKGIDLTGSEAEDSDGVDEDEEVSEADDDGEEASEIDDGDDSEALNLASSAADKRKAQAKKKASTESKLAKSAKAAKAKASSAAKAAKSRAASAAKAAKAKKAKAVKSGKAAYKKVKSFRPLAKKPSKPSSKRVYPPKKSKSKISMRPKGAYIPPDPGPNPSIPAGPKGGNAGPLARPSSGQGNAKKLYRPNALQASKTSPKPYSGASGNVYIPPSPVAKVKMAGAAAEVSATRPQQNFHPGSSFKPRDPASEAASQLLGVRQYKKVKGAQGGTAQDQKDALKGMTDVDFLAAPGSKPVKVAKKTMRLPGGKKIYVGPIGEVSPGEVLGKGGFGQVRAMDVKDKDGKVHQFAAKVFKDDESFERAQASKAQVADLGQNKHLLRDYGAGIDKNGQKVLIAERGGQDFKQQFLRNRPPKAVVDKAMKGMVDGMAHVHSKGKVHWDFKPQNVIMGGDGEAKIIDLDDLSPTSKDPRHADGRIGTPGFRAPERVARRKPGSPPFDWQKSDVYSVGAGLLEVKTGKPVYGIFKDLLKKDYDDRDVVNGKFHSALKGDPRYAGQGSARSQAIIQMLDPDPVNRPDLKDVQQHFK